VSPGQLDAADDRRAALALIAADSISTEAEQGTP
jgi:hypothetical protein